MSNCPDYVAIWFGITQAGCAVALLNTNLVGDALLHSIRTAGSRRIIVSSALLPAIVAILPKLGGETRISVHGHGGHNRFERVELAVASAGASEGAPSLDAMGSRLPASDDRALLIYTSGTTGAAEGGHRDPCACTGVERLVRRHDGRAAGRPAL